MKKVLIIPICLLLTAFVFGAFFSCKKRSNCFDWKLYQQYKNSGCTFDCPGVTGCDGKLYCNECEANQQGIHILK